MQLRELRWRQNLRLGRYRTMPKMYTSYGNTDIWASQLHVLDNDLLRMPSMDRGNVIRLVKRHAAAVPWHPYTQGHLYLIHTMALVLRDELSLYWGYTRICRLLHPFGPDTAYGTHMIPDNVYALMPYDVDRDVFDVTLRLRWLYIMFGQTFTSASGLCAIWDYILPEFTNIYRVCTALLIFGIENDCCQGSDGKCTLERLAGLVSIQISTDAAVAEIIARSQSVVLR